MRALMLVGLGWVAAVAGCAGPLGASSAGADKALAASKVAVAEVVGPAVPLLPAAAATARAPRPFPMHTSPCPLKTTLKGPPVCSFEPEVGGDRGPVMKVERITCRVTGQTAFVGLGAQTALAVHMSVVEASSSFVVTFLRQPDGVVHLVPDALTQPVVWGGGLVGLAAGPRLLSFWKDGVCEEPPDGWLTSLAPVSEDELVALLQRWDRSIEVLVRSRAGAWASLGSIEAGLEVRLHDQGGRLALEVENRDAARELGLRFPELERSEIVARGRFSTPNPPVVAMAPLPARPGSRFGDAWVTQLEWVEGVLSVSRPVPDRGYQRTLVSSRLQRDECRDGVGDAEREGSHADSPFRAVSTPAVLALSRDRALVAWVEQRGRCRWRHLPQEATHCQPGQPCRPPPPAHWASAREVEETTLALVGVGGDVREVLRVPLASPDDSRSLAGISLASTERQVFVQAWGHLVQLDRAKLEELVR